MGQYFYAAVGTRWPTTDKFLPTSWVNPGDYDEGLKFMEHAYTRNPVVCKVMDIIRLPKDVTPENHLARRVVWAGDYGPKEDGKYTLYYSLWQYHNDLKVKDVVKFDPKLKYIVNVSKKEWVDCSLTSFSYDALKVSALAALTATPMGGNGGDFGGNDADQVGLWSGDLIYSTTSKSKIPKSYTQRVVNFHV